MFKHILVPLDGSHLAEAVLPAVTYLAENMKAKVTLLHVIEKDAPQQIHGEKHLTDEKDASVYLAGVAEKYFPEQIQVEWHVHALEVKDISEGLVDHIDELHPDLIVMCSHGHGGMRDWMVGSVAQQIIATGKIPVLLYKPDDQEQISGRFCHVLVALDGNPEHEQGLPLAVEMAKGCDSDLNLITVIHSFTSLPGERAAAGHLLPVSTVAMLDMLEEEAVRYLKEVAGPIKGLKITISVERGEPVEKILATVEKLGSDLLVLGTHGKSGLGAFWAGSVGAKIINQSHTPMLLVPVAEKS